MYRGADNYSIQGENVDKDRMHEVYVAASAARQRLFVATEREINAELGLRKLTLAALISGALAGKNENEREGQARLKFASDYTELEEAQMDARLAKLQFELEQLRLSEVRAMLRIEELAARVQPHDDEMKGDDNGSV